MGAQDLLAALSEKGIKISLDGDMIEVDAPRGAMTDDLRDAIRERKDELLELLRSEPEGDTPPAPLGKVGRHGAPCPKCGDTWQWPRSRGEWVCSWCICAAPGGVQIASEG